MTAVEALRRARATRACGENYDRDCWFYESGDSDLKNGVAGSEHGRLNRDLHVDVASLLLDGFTVRQVTAAEHTTDQPHE